MSTQLADYSSVLSNRKPAWAGIFSGTFLFLAIETTFGVLGASIFSSAGAGMSIGAAIWMVVLTIIALYSGARLASSYSATGARNVGIYAGLVTYGVSVFAAFLTAGLWFFTFGPPSAHAGAAGMAMPYLIPAGYSLSAAMILGMIAAAIGGIHGAMTGGPRSMERTTERSTERTAETKRVA